MTSITLYTQVLMLLAILAGLSMLIGLEWYWWRERKRYRRWIAGEWEPEFKWWRFLE